MSIKELSQEEKHINEMFDGLEKEIERRKSRAMDGATRLSLEKQLESLKKSRVHRLVECREKYEEVKTE